MTEKRPLRQCIESIFKWVQLRHDMWSTTLPEARYFVTMDFFECFNITFLLNIYFSEETVLEAANRVRNVQNAWAVSTYLMLFCL